MDAGFAENLVVAELAASVGLSTYHFIRAFSAAYGETPGQYLKRRRMERAKVLLVTSDLPIAEVGRRVGYRSHGTFSDRFRKYFGMTPTQYRRSFGNLEEVRPEPPA
jgi:AraC-like DNA-binding protein